MVQFKPRLIGIYVGLAAIFVACGKPDVDPGADGELPVVIGYRGMGTGILWPENTLESIRRAIELGADGIEVDIQLTSDDQFVIFHDLDLKPHTTCTGSVSDQTLEELEQCRIESFHKKAFIPSLESVFDEIEPTETIIFLDTKVPRQMNETETDAYFERYNKAMALLLSNYDVSDQVYIEGDDVFHEHFVNDFGFNQVATGNDFDTNISVAQINGAVAVGISEELVSAEDLERAHNEGLKAVLWTLTTRNRVDRAIEKGADFLQTDCVKYSVELMEEE